MMVPLPGGEDRCGHMEPDGMDLTGSGRRFSSIQLSRLHGGSPPLGFCFSSERVSPEPNHYPASGEKPAEGRKHRVHESTVLPVLKSQETIPLAIPFVCPKQTDQPDGVTFAFGAC